MTDRFPCQWPLSQPRTPLREKSRFKVRQSAAFARLRQELERLGASHVEITANLPIGSRGSFLIDEGVLKDPAVAVFFKMRGKGQGMCIACDRWIGVGDNAHAISLTIEAIRGIDRWGSSQMRDQAFTGFAALPPPKPAEPALPPHHWRMVLRLGFGHLTLEQVRKRHRELAFEAHPDRGGDHDTIVYLNRALDEAEQELT